tara:strand:+ start:83 stop:481 length:399 start_codon:yes stop_codon:yes gene_type:complete
MSGSDSGGNIELILKHFIEQFAESTKDINKRLDKMTESMNDLRSHKGLVLQLEKRTDALEDRYISMNEKVTKLVYDSNRRDDIKKTITNPLIQRSLFSILGVVACSLCFVVGFSYKTIDQKSTKEMKGYINH